MKSAGRIDDVFRRAGSPVQFNNGELKSVRSLLERTQEERAPAPFEQSFYSRNFLDTLLRGGMDAAAFADKGLGSAAKKFGQAWDFFGLGDGQSAMSVADKFAQSAQHIFANLFAPQNQPFAPMMAGAQTENGAMRSPASQSSFDVSSGKAEPSKPVGLPEFVKDMITNLKGAKEELQKAVNRDEKVEDQYQKFEKFYEETLENVKKQDYLSEEAMESALEQVEELKEEGDTLYETYLDAQDEEAPEKVNLPSEIEQKISALRQEKKTLEEEAKRAGSQQALSDKYQNFLRKYDELRGEIKSVSYVSEDAMKYALSELKAVKTQGSEIFEAKMNTLPKKAPEASPPPAADPVPEAPTASEPEADAEAASADEPEAAEPATEPPPAAPPAESEPQPAPEESAPEPEPEPEPAPEPAPPPPQPDPNAQIQAIKKFEDQKNDYLAEIGSMSDVSELERKKQEILFQLDDINASLPKDSPERARIIALSEELTKAYYVQRDSLQSPAIPDDFSSPRDQRDLAEGMIEPFLLAVNDFTTRVQGQRGEDLSKMERELGGLQRQIDTVEQEVENEISDRSILKETSDKLWDELQTAEVAFENEQTREAIEPLEEKKEELKKSLTNPEETLASVTSKYRDVQETYQERARYLLSLEFNTPDVKKKTLAKMDGTFTAASMHFTHYKTIHGIMEPIYGSKAAAQTATLIRENSAKPFNELIQLAKTRVEEKRRESPPSVKSSTTAAIAASPEEEVLEPLEAERRAKAMKQRVTKAVISFEDSLTKFQEDLSGDGVDPRAKMEMYEENDEEGLPAYLQQIVDNRHLSQEERAQTLLAVHERWEKFKASDEVQEILSEYDQKIRAVTTTKPESGSLGDAVFAGTGVQAPSKNLESAEAPPSTALPPNEAMADMIDGSSERYAIKSAGGDKFVDLITDRADRILKKRAKEERLGAGQYSIPLQFVVTPDASKTQAIVRLEFDRARVRDLKGRGITEKTAEKMLQDLSFFVPLPGDVSNEWFGRKTATFDDKDLQSVTLRNPSKRIHRVVPLRIS